MSTDPPIAPGVPIARQSMAFAESDRTWMLRALDLAQRGLCTTTPNPRVGCVLVRDGNVIGEGYTQPAGQDHAEIQALKDCAARGNSPAGATAYVSLEPCSHHGRTPPCTDALIAAAVARVVAAVADPNPRVAGAGLARLNAAGIDTSCGIRADQARELNVGFFSRMERGRPWVRVKMAASLDGRSALANGESRWITGAAAREDGHAWRARACAVMTGVGTVLADDPQLSVRHVRTTRQPLRVVIDSRGRTPADAKVLAGGPVLVYTAIGPPAAWPKHVQTRECAGDDGKVDLGRVLADLAEREINELHVEAGPRLSGALVRAGLADELLVYLAATLLGDSARAMFALPPLRSLDQRLQLRITGVERVGDDVRLLARFAGGTASGPVVSGIGR